jgi:pimeloyl-ACP methyl ester carboxylesterase
MHTLSIHYFHYRNIRISYTDTGSGLIVVLLHGFAETGAVWDEQVAFLQNHCRVIVPEVPGADWTGTDDEIRLASSIETMGNAVAALIQEVTTEPVIVLGHSMGGYIALALAEKHPYLLKGFGFVHSTAFADTEAKKETRRKGMDFIRRNGSEAFFKTSAPGLFSETSKQQQPTLVQRNIDLAVRFAPELLIANYEAMMVRPDRTNVLTGSAVPVLFIVGTDDTAAPAADIIKQVHLPKVAYFHLLEKVGHMGMWEATETVNSLILNFIQDCG